MIVLRVLHVCGLFICVCIGFVGWCIYFVLTLCDCCICVLFLCCFEFVSCYFCVGCMVLRLWLCCDAFVVVILLCSLRVVVLLT